METEKYAELRLYYGLCSNEGCSEGRFGDFRKEDSWYKNRFEKAMRTVHRYLEPNFSRGLRLASGSLVRGEDEAKTLIQFAEKNINDTSGIIELIDSMHGEISFWRKIHFSGWTIEQQERLIGELKKSNYEPVNREKERIERMRKLSANNEEWNRFINQQLGELDQDKPWKEALKFF